MLPRNIGWPQVEWISPETRRQRGMEDPTTSDGSVIGAHVSLSHLLTFQLDGVHGVAAMGMSRGRRAIRL